MSSVIFLQQPMLYCASPFFMQWVHLPWLGSCIVAPPCRRKAVCAALHAAVVPSVCASVLSLLSMKWVG